MSAAPAYNGYMPQLYEPGILEREVLKYLVEHDFLRRDDILDDFTIARQSGRNMLLKVVTRRGWPSYIVKIGQGTGPGTVSFESKIYLLLKAQRGIGSYCARYVGASQFHSVFDILIIECRPGTPASRPDFLGERYQEFAALLGRALASLHCRSFQRQVPQALQPQVLSAEFLLPSPVLASHLSPASMEVVQSIAQFPQFADLLAGLREEWNLDSFIHGDVKGANTIVDMHTTEAPLTLTLVDWELAGLGDSCWDIGSVLADYLDQSLRSLDDSIPGSPVLAQHSTIQCAIGNFWSNYCAARLEEGVILDQQAVLRSARYAAVRLLQNTIEYAQSQASMLTREGIYALQMCWNILAKPEVAVTELFALA
jgi:thiamine kinase-like enzyme